MKFWILMLILDLMVPFVMVGVGWYLLSNKIGIKKLFGYKTVMMTKNADTEQFAYDFCCKYYILVGFLMVPISVIALTFVISDTIGMVAFIGGMIMTLQGLLFVGAPLATEIALRRRFDKDGRIR